MTILFASISALAFASALGKLLKRNLERDYPSADRELEAALAEGIQLAFSNPTTSHPSLD